MLRLDRLASVYLFHPLRGISSALGGRVPILMYHSISDGEQGRHSYFQTTCTPEVFEAQMEWLARNGYEILNLHQTLHRFKLNGNKAGRVAVITFDDGYRDFYTAAFPILSKHGFTATVFLPSSYIGEEHRRFKGIECMTWREIRELHAAGIDFGSHTVSHPQLWTLPADQVRTELRDSKGAIEDQLGVAVTTFSYPFAFPEQDAVFSDLVRSSLLEFGYLAGVTTIIGTASGKDDPMLLPRLPVNSGDDPALLRAKLEGGYDWLHAPQYIKKKILQRRTAPGYRPSTA